MNAVHLRDEINPFASVSYATYAELEVEELAPVVARPRKTLQPPGLLKKVRDRPNRIPHRMRAGASRFVNLEHFARASHLRRSGSVRAGKLI